MLFRKIIPTLVGITFLFFPVVSQIYGQEDGTDSTRTQCPPESLTVSYDAYYSESTTAQQVFTWYALAKEYYKNAHYKNETKKLMKAVPDYWKVIENDKTGKFRIAYSRLTECYFQNGYADSALIVAVRGLKKYPNESILHYYAGQIYKELGYLRCAIPHYQALIKISGEKNRPTIKYWEVLAQLYFQLGDEKAIEAQKKVMELDPNNAQAAVLLSEMMESMGMDPIDALRTAFEKDSSNIQNAIRYGKAALNAGEYRETIRAFRAVLQKNPKNTMALEYIGRAEEGLEHLSHAVREYKKILKIKPKDANILSELASVYSRMNKFSLARSYAHKALKVRPKYGNAYMVLAEIYENAVSYCTARRKKKGLTYDDKLVYELARKAYKKAAAVDPSVAASARKRYKQLEPFIRTRADIHMHSKRTTLKSPCYHWISQ